VPVRLVLIDPPIAHPKVSRRLRTQPEQEIARHRADATLPTNCVDGPQNAARNSMIIDDTIANIKSLLLPRASGIGRELARIGQSEKRFSWDPHRIFDQRPQIGQCCHSTLCCSRLQ